MLEFAKVSMGAGEPPRCMRCRPSDSERTYLPAAEIAGQVAAAVAGWHDGPGPNVELSGPEPLAHPELPALVASAIKGGVKRLRLLTDAGGFAAGANAAGAIAAGVLHVRFILLGGTPGIHDALIGTHGAFDSTLAGVSAYVAAAASQDRDVHVSAIVPVCRHSVRDLPAAVGAAVRAGADEVVLRVDDGGMDLCSAVPWVSSACATGVVNGAWVEVEGVPFCLMGEEALHVADVVRGRPGDHGPGCSGCALKGVCAGGPAGASADALASLSPPADAERLAARVLLAREGMAS